MAEWYELFEHSAIGVLPGGFSVGRGTDIGQSAHEIVAVASRSLPTIDPLAERIRCRLLDAWPAFGEDAELHDELCRAIHANLRQVFERVMSSASSEVLAAPAEALNLATSVLHHGLDTSELIQAYRVGQNVAWSWWMEHLAAQVEDRRLLLEAIELSSERMFAYVDAVVDEQVHLWESERERWAGRQVAHRAEAVRRVLSGEPLRLEESVLSIGYSLERELVAGILWEPGERDVEDGSPSGLERTADAIAHSVGIERTLIVPAGAASLWAWFAIDRSKLDRQLGLDALAQTAERHLREGQGIALGLPGTGIDGFRSSHRQALRARRLAELSPAQAGVIRFDEVEMLCVMNDDPELLEGFVERKLGALAADENTVGRLRETVLVWLREGGNARRTAERLHTHRNTVLYRVQRAEQILGRPLGEDRLGLELALMIVQRIGPPRGR
jgi:DNA-binding PucR family transcriptional regulator